MRKTTTVRSVKDIYVVKYWFTQGILHVVEADVQEYKSGRRMAEWGMYGTYAHNDGFFFTYEEACEHVAKLAQKRLASVKKSLAKIETITNMALIKGLKLVEIDNQNQRMARDRKVEKT